MGRNFAIDKGNGFNAQIATQTKIEIHLNLNGSRTTKTVIKAVEKKTQYAIKGEKNIEIMEPV